MELRVNQHALGVRVPQGDNLRPALLRKLPSYFRLADQSGSDLLESGRQMDNFYGKRVFRLCTEMDFRKIVNGVSRRIASFKRVTGGSRAAPPQAIRPT